MCELFFFIFSSFYLHINLGCQYQELIRLKYPPFQGVRFGEITSTFSIRLQSYGGFPNISLSMIFTLFPFISLYFTGIEKSIEKAFILQTERADNHSNKR